MPETGNNVVDLHGTELADSRLSTDENGNKVLQLTAPVMDGKDEISALIFHRPRAADLAAMDETKGEVGKTIRAISRITNQTVKTIERLDGYDLLQAGAVLADFLQRPR